MGSSDSGISDQQYQNLKVIRVIRILRVLKLTRVFRASRILSRWNAVIGMSIALSQLGKYSLFMVVLSHWLACVWGLAPEFESYPDGENWMTAYKIDNETSSKYIASLYWSIMTIGTIGYGDVRASTNFEKCVAVLCMTIGCGAYSFSKISN